jgi:hypothetical protein
MHRNPLVLVAAGLAAALLTLAAVALLSRSPEPVTRPLALSPGEQLRLQPSRPRPQPADPHAVARKLAGTALLPGDQVLVSALQAELARGGAPSYKTAVDVPVSDNAAQAVRDEVKEWLAAKMAGLGYRETGGRPTVLWQVHIDPAAEGRYTLRTVLRSGGAVQLDQSFELPARYAADRVSDALGAAFAPPAR